MVDCWRLTAASCAFEEKVRQIVKRMAASVAIRMTILSFCAALFFSACAAPSISRVDKGVADYLFTNAKIYTVNEERPWAQAIAVQGDKIIYVGASDYAKKFVGKKTKVFDLGGKMVLPGFIDSHVHPIWGGETFLRVNLRNAASIKQVQASLLKYREKNPSARYITGTGWNGENFSPDDLTRKAIDEVVSDIPVILYDHLGHTAWVNTKTLELAGINKDTKDPEGGKFSRDTITGDLTGLAKEHAAFEMIEKAIQDNEEDLHVEALKQALRYLNSNGITSFVNAYMVGDPLGDAFIKLHKDSKLTARVALSFKIDGDRAIDETLEDIIDRRSLLEEIDHDFITASTVKIFLDGIMLNYTAAMLAPYVGEYKKYNSTGYLFNDSKLKSYASALDNAGFQLHFHAVGDGATRQALSVVEHLATENGQKDRRAGISHLTIVSPEDFRRISELDVYANAQLFWARRTRSIEKVEIFAGPQRSERIMAYGALHNAGATIIGGSDWPVTTANPFAAMQMVATRPSIIENADDQEVWLPEQRITDVEALIKAYTIDGARWQFREDVIGSLEVGKFADLIVIDQNILDIPVSQLRSTNVLMTMCNGKIVYEKPLN